MSQSSTSKLQTVHDILCREIREKHQVGDRLPTEHELAARFGCSVATISKALSLLAHDGWVERRPRAGTKVIRNTAAASTAKSDIKLEAFAFVYPSEKHEAILRTVRGFQDAAIEADCRVLTITTGADCDKEIEFLGRISEFAVNGAVLHPVLLTPSEHTRFAQKVINCPVPIVLSGMRLAGVDNPSVGIDGFHAGYTATNYLVKRGLKKIGFLTNNAGAMEKYYGGYQWALEEAGITPSAEWELLEATMHPNYEDPQKEPLALGHQYLSKDRGVEGVVCPCDGMAVALIQAALERGLKVPEDLKVVGTDDVEIARTSLVPLTTYHVPYEEIGRKTFEVLKATVAGTFTGFSRVNVRGDMVVRTSA